MVVLDYCAQTAALVKGVYGIVGLLHAVELVGDVVVDGQLQKTKAEPKKVNFETTPRDNTYRQTDRQT